MLEKIKVKACNVVFKLCLNSIYAEKGKSSESVQCAMLKACDACADIGQL